MGRSVYIYISENATIFLYNTLFINTVFQAYYAIISIHIYIFNSGVPGVVREIRKKCSFLAYTTRLLIGSLKFFLAHSVQPNLVEYSRHIYMSKGLFI